MYEEPAMAKKAKVDIKDWRVAFGFGLIIGMLIVGLPQIIGVAILLSMLVLTLKLVEKGRV